MKSFGRRGKKLFMCFMMLCLCLSSLGSAVGTAYGAASDQDAPSASLPAAFADIKDHWAEKPLSAWIANDYIEGYPDGTFKPDHAVNRGEAVALINRSFGFHNKGRIDFSDLTVTDWEYEELAKAVDAGYAGGYPDGTIAAKREISRQEAAMMIARLLGLEVGGEDTSANGFKDAAQIAQWSKGAVAAVAAAQIMEGYEDGSFKPEAFLTRAEAVAILDRALASKAAFTFDRAGTYGPSGGVRQINGDVVVSASDVILQNMKIEGNLLLAESIGEGDVFLRNVTVQGTTNVKGGGMNSIHVDNGMLAEVIVDRAVGTVRIVVTGNTVIAETVVKSSVILEESGADPDTGFRLVKLSEVLANGSKVTMIGTFDRVHVDAESISILLEKGMIGELAVAESASGASIQVGKKARIVSMIVDAIIKVIGEGVIEKAAVNEKARGTTFENRPLLEAGAGAQASGASKGGNGGNNGINNGGNGGNNGNNGGSNGNNGGNNGNNGNNGGNNGNNNGGNEPSASAVIAAVYAVNGSISVTFDKVPNAVPAIGDFAVQQLIDNGPPASAAPTHLAWDENTKTAVLTVPVVHASESGQSVVYRVSYKGAASVDAAAFVVPGGIPIVLNGEAKAVVVAPVNPELPVDQIPGWHNYNTFLKGKVRVVDTKKHSGGNSLHINDEDAMNYTVESNRVEVSPGSSYTASAQYYLESGDPYPALLIYFYDENGSLIDFYPYDIGDQTGVWAELSCTGTAPAQAKYAAVVLQSDSTGKRSVYFDDVVFKETGGAELPVQNPGFENNAGIAVDTLVEYVRKASGAALPILTEEQLQQDDGIDPDLIRIYVGGSTPTGDAEIDQALAAINTGGFVIRTEDSAIAIIGSTSEGTEFGVYEFLERYLGVRWLMPGDEGEHVPKRSTIIVPQELVREEPAAISRHIFWMETPASNVDWLRHNRMHDNIQFHHNLEYLFDPAVFSDHPEYYPGGVLPEPGTWEWNPCLNDDTAAAAIARIKQYFQQNPQASSFSLGVTDSRKHCESDPSHPNYPGADHLNSIGLLNISDLYYPWVNKIAEGVLEEYPDKYFGLLAYAQVYDPPMNADGTPFKLNSHVIPYITDDRVSWLDPEIDAEAQAHMERWKKSATNFGFYEYLFGSPYSLPRMYLHKMAENYRYAKENGVIGHVAEWMPNFGEGPKLWISAKLQWNPDRDVEQLTNEWYATVVGSASAPFLQEYYEHWEDFWTRRAFESEWYLMWKHSVPRSNYLNIYTHDYLKMITKEELQASRVLMQKVVDLAETDEQRARAEYLMGTFEFYEASALSYPRTQAVPVPADEASALAMVADFRQSIEMAEKRKQYIADNQMKYMQMWDGVQQVLINALLAYVAAHEDENGVIRGELDQIMIDFPGIIRQPAYAVKTNAGEEIILQSLDFNQGPWVHAKPFNQFLTTPDKQQPPVETKVRLLWDDDNLYVGYENFDSDIGAMVYNDAVSGNWWDGPTPDSVETFLGDTSTMYKGFFSNMNDVKFGFKMGINPPTGRQASPETQWKVGSRIYGDRWNTVQVIPFASIDIDPEIAGSLMGFFLRNYHGQNLYLSWYGGNTWATEDFNVIHLEDNQTAPEIWVTAVNGSIQVKLPEGSEAPTAGDFQVEQEIMPGAPAPITAALDSWNPDSRIAVLTVPAVAAGESDQSVVYRVSYKNGPPVEAAAFLVKGQIVIVEDGLAKAVVVVPTPTDHRIPGWRLTHPIGEMEAGKMKIVSSKSYGGGHSVHIDDASVTQVQSLESNLVPVTGGEAYTVSAMTYGESGSLPLLLIYYYDLTKTLIDAGYVEGGITGQWAPISITRAAPANAAYASAVLFSDSVGVRNMYFDDVVMKNANGDELPIGNPGFELVSNGAAETLAEYVRKSSAAVLLVVTEEELSGGAESFEGYVRIYVGGSIPTGNPAIDQALEGLPDDGFVIDAAGNKITIIGPTDTGTERGVKHFLERYLGVRWAVPGGDDEVVPPMSTIAIPRS